MFLLSANMQIISNNCDMRALANGTLSRIKSMHAYSIDISSERAKSYIFEGVLELAAGCSY